MSDEKQRQIFATNLNQLILHSKKQQKEIAAELGISPTTFNTWCMGKSIPGMGKMQILADYFHVKKADLLEESLDSDSTYYLNEDAREMAQFMFENPEYRVLFDASKKVKKEDIEFIKEFIDKWNTK